MSPAVYFFFYPPAANIVAPIILRRPEFLCHKPYRTKRHYLNVGFIVVKNYTDRQYFPFCYLYKLESRRYRLNVIRVLNTEDRDRRVAKCRKFNTSLFI